MLTPSREELAKAILDLTGAGGADFPSVALRVFHYQRIANPIYARFLELLSIDPQAVRRTSEIPYLPIALFKTQSLRSGSWLPERTFTSSGTTGAAVSRHDLRDPAWYRRNARRTFEQIYGPLAGFTILALLPAYLERQGSSLVFMVDDFIAYGGQAESNFFLNDLDQLIRRIEDLGRRGEKILLLGVSFALLDLAERYGRPLPAGTVVMETGGMKGRRKELTRNELHQLLQDTFELDHIHSEYGMTELFSQAYAPTQGRFLPAPTMRVLAREVTDPFAIRPSGKTGALNIIDLANLDTISFIATDDLGRVAADGTFTVEGRLDASDLRGCNLLVQDL